MYRNGCGQTTIAGSLPKPAWLATPNQLWAPWLLDGVDLEHRQTVRIRNRYDADVPMVVGPVGRPHPVYVDDAKFLRGETERKVKYTLPGPMTMVDTLYDAHYRSPEKLARGKLRALGAGAALVRAELGA